LEALETIPLDRIDEIGFGLIVMNRSGEVTGYNASESRLSRPSCQAGRGPELLRGGRPVHEQLPGRAAFPGL
jgi:hypothetical protein